ncbi:MAG: hypothetical protein K2X66_01545 [Cyanobacteria bacterium]|nr:hypothetical protein [Cyanobacteriota bacterium]
MKLLITIAQFKRYSGNQLVEYVVPLAIVGLAIIAASSILSPNLKNFIGHQMSDSGEQAPSSSEVSIRRLGKNPLTSRVLLTLSDGTQITLSQYPTNLKLSIESIGADGTTDLLANALIELAQKLANENKITPDQSTALIKLANSGHHLAKVEGLISDAVEKTYHHPEQFGSQTIQYEGQPLEMFYVAHLLGGAGGVSDNDILNQKNILKPLNPGTSLALRDLISGYSNAAEGIKNQGAFLNSFTELYSDVLHSGALKEPSVSNLVKSLAAEIYTLSQNTAYVTRGLARQSDSVTNASEFKQVLIQNTENSHINSRGICIVGNGKDRGQSCSED